MSEIPFRIATLCITLAGVIISSYFRRQADQVGGTVSRQTDGAVMSTLLIICGFSGWLATLIYIVAPTWMSWSQIRLPPPIRWLGALIGLLTVPVFYWIFSHLGHNVTPTAQTRSNAVLITTGPYRWVRHPLYTVGTISFLGLSLLTANWFIAVTVMLAQFILRQRTVTEEANLVARFGDQYQHYMAQTGRFWPKL